MAMGRKTSGRQKGSQNKVNVATRERIEQECDPIGFMMKVARGESIERRRLSGDGTETLETISPTPEQQIDANVFLARKLMPDAKAATISMSLPEIKTAEDVLIACMPRYRHLHQAGGLLLAPASLYAVKTAANRWHSIRSACPRAGGSASQSPSRAVGHGSYRGFRRARSNAPITADCAYTRGRDEDRRRQARTSLHQYRAIARTGKSKMPSELEERHIDVRNRG